MTTQKEIKPVKTLLCVMCGQMALYLSRTNSEPLCGRCIVLDERLNFQKGRIDRNGNKLEKPERDTKINEIKAK